jgi:hypothetical protein
MVYEMTWVVIGRMVRHDAVSDRMGPGEELTLIVRFREETEGLAESLRTYAVVLDRYYKQQSGMMFAQIETCMERLAGK